jgi:hypothetical protein
MGGGAAFSPEGTYPRRPAPRVAPRGDLWVGQAARAGWKAHATTLGPGEVFAVSAYPGYLKEGFEPYDPLELMRLQAAGFELF